MRRSPPTTAARGLIAALATALLAGCGASPPAPAMRHGLPVRDAPPAALDAAALAHLVARTTPRGSEQTNELK